ncbi:phytoene desaturase family protein [Elongatibacter sediminis]|uniref:NAD(P)-binding protein n=1 Tax=Elongatibacter sediminis TaxID=3119006 RepID=A0AAW9RFH6_9GAMM
MNRSFDVLILGADLNGLNLATSLAERGKRVALLDTALKLGGPFRTESFLTSHRYELGAGWILGEHHPEPAATLFENGTVHSMRPEIPLAYLFDDRPPLCLYRDPDRTFEQLASRDSRGLLALMTEGESLFESTVIRLANPEAAEGYRRSPPGTSTSPLFDMTVREALDHFGLPDPALRCVLTYLPLALGHDIRSTGSAAALAALVYGMSRMSLISGGAGLLVNGLTDRISRQGGLICEAAKVQTVNRDGNRITSLELADGRSFSAPLIVSGDDSLTPTGQRDEPAAAVPDESLGILRMYLDFLHDPGGFALPSDQARAVNRAYLVGFGFENEHEIHEHLAAMRGSQPQRIAGHLINNHFQEAAEPVGALSSLNEPLWCASCHSTDPETLRQRATDIAARHGRTIPSPQATATDHTGVRIRPRPVSAMWQSVLPFTTRAVDPEGFRRSYEQATVREICRRLAKVEPDDLRFRLTWLPAETGESLMDGDLTRILHGDLPRHQQNTTGNLLLDRTSRSARYLSLQTAPGLIAAVDQRIA